MRGADEETKIVVSLTPDVFNFQMAPQWRDPSRAYLSWSATG
jgi:hypothetical protein